MQIPQLRHALTDGCRDMHVGPTCDWVTVTFAGVERP